MNSYHIINLTSNISHSPCLRGLLTCLVAVSVITNSYAQPEKTTSNSELRSRPLYQTIQQALDTLSRAEIAREEAALAGNPAKKMAALRAQCRAAISQLRALQPQLAQLLRQNYQQRPSKRDKNDWTTRELESLDRNLKVQLARAYRNQALCYPAESPDRINSLSLALEQLPDVVTLPLDEASVWQARLEQIDCLRLVNKTAVARQRIELWNKASPPANIASKLTGASLKLDLDEGALDRALSRVEALRAAGKSPSEVAPETDDAILEILLAAGQRSPPSRKQQLTQRAVRQLQHIAKTHGPYWQRRAEARLGHALAAQPNSDDPKLLNYAAASQYAAGKPHEAVATYDRVATLLAIGGHTDQQFQALKTAAAIVREMKQTAAALPRFRQLAIQHPQHPEAAPVHLIAIGLAAQLSRAATPAQRGETFERYLSLLKEHLEFWPDEPSTKKVQQWLARTELPEIEQERVQTLTALGDRQQALAIYRKLSANNQNDAELLEAYASLLTEGTDRFELQEALRIWQKIETRSKPGGPRWWRGRRARLSLLEQLGEGKKAKQLRQLTEILYPEGE